MENFENGSKENFDEDIKKLEELLERIKVDMNSFLKGENSRDILKRRFPELATSVGWEYLNNKRRKK